MVPCAGWCVGPPPQWNGGPFTPKPPALASASIQNPTPTDVCLPQLRLLRVSCYFLPRSILGSASSSALWRAQDGPRSLSLGPPGAAKPLVTAAGVRPSLAQAAALLTPYSGYGCAWAAGASGRPPVAAARRARRFKTHGDGSDLQPGVGCSPSCALLALRGRARLAALAVLFFALFAAPGWAPAAASAMAAAARARCRSGRVALQDPRRRLQACAPGSARAAAPRAPLTRLAHGFSKPGFTVAASRRGSARAAALLSLFVCFVAGLGLQPVLCSRALRSARMGAGGRAVCGSGGPR